MQPVSTPDAREFARSAPKTEIRIGGVDDLHALDVPARNPATIDAGQWKAAEKRAVIAAMLAERAIIVRDAGKGQVEIENRLRQPIVISLVESKATAA